MYSITLKLSGIFRRIAKAIALLNRFTFASLKAELQGYFLSFI